MNVSIQSTVQTVLIFSIFVSMPLPLSAFQQSTWPKHVIERVKASDNEALRDLLKNSEAEIKSSVEFIITHMPQRDLESLESDFLLNDIRKAHEIRKSAKWQISDELFLNFVLPYANVDETRESWREKLNKLCAPLVKDCENTGDAAQVLNRKLFPLVKVKYSTQRKKANQSPSESIDQGLASCTGLSILLVAACRSIGVPARLEGIPSWPNKRGNHTWVEVWHNGRWHFTGAAEPAEKLNQTWFQNDAALARKESRLNAIYAVSFAQTETVFPLVWSRDKKNPVYAINVTDTYTTSTKTKDKSKVDVYIRVWDHQKKNRLPLSVTVVDPKNNAKRITGVSPDNEADMNDMLTFQLLPNHTYELQIGSSKRGEQPIHTQKLKTTDQRRQTIDIKISK